MPKYKDSGCQVNRIEKSNITLSNRGGLLFLLRYLDNIQFFKMVDKTVTGVRLSSKGKCVGYMFRQILAFLIDGSIKAISGFDNLLNNEGYAATLEVKVDNLVSSHSVKRFFRKFTLQKSFMLRKVLNTLFIWRLCVEKPPVIIMDIDTMVLNNDDALKRHGVSPTYKKKKGFQPLQVTWRGIVVDAMFRKGSAHSNHGKDVQHTMRRIVKLIRKRYKADIPIIVTCDSGFLDEKNLLYFDKTLGILYTCNGKLYDSVLNHVRKIPRFNFHRYSNERSEWEYTEFDSHLDSWDKLGYTRTLFTRLIHKDDGQTIMDFARPDSVIYTNIGQNAELTKALKKAGGEEFVTAKGVITLAHGRGCSELTNRSLKDFMLNEHMPFKRFGPNSAYYYTALIGHCLQDAYQRDVLQKVIPGKLVTYPSTFRRTFIDFAAKIARGGNAIRFQIARAVFERLEAVKIWARCVSERLIPVPLLM